MKHFQRRLAAQPTPLILQNRCLWEVWYQWGLVLQPGEGHLCWTKCTCSFRVTPVVSSLEHTFVTVKLMTPRSWLPAIPKGMSFIRLGGINMWFPSRHENGRFLHMFVSCLFLMTKSVKVWFVIYRVVSVFHRTASWCKEGAREPWYSLERWSEFIYFTR